jgi:hypothetical protein
MMASLRSAWNDFDFVHTGGQGCGTHEMLEPQPRTHCPGQTDDEYRTELTMWCAVENSPGLTLLTAQMPIPG